LEKKYPTWEVLGVVIGFVGSASLVPELVNLLFNFFPDSSKMSREFKLICISVYLVVIVVLSFRYLINLRGTQKENSDGIVVTSSGRGGGYMSAMSGNGWISFARDFPISLFRMVVSKLYKIVLFDIFNRRPEWDLREDLFRQFLRAYFKPRTVELQFLRNFEAIEVRETSENSDNFGEPKRARWTELEFPLLTFTTWLGLFWTLCHFSVISKAFSKFRILVAVLYFFGFVLHGGDVLDLRLSFSTMNAIWKSWIVFLLIFDLLTAVGLLLKKIWGEIFLLIVSISQLIAYTQFSHIFEEQIFLVRFHIIVLSIYFLLRGIEWLRSGLVTTDIRIVSRGKSEN